ncbi:disease resistance protein RGA3 [Canna indica]|uniref:Disease resistance protein RGA3 n=1 Tax=Canna indica TaxID=4628 RepID=A0AAQ3JKX6_9LILI|nr:disease resistance protein RGA3 [Canna indica]
MAMILTAFIPQVIRVLDGIVEQETIQVSGVTGVTDEIKGLLRRLKLLRNIVQDAESKSRNERDIQWWLSKLRDVIYDVDDVIDQCKIQGERNKRLLGQQDCSFGAGLGVKCYFPLFSCFTRVALLHGIADRIKSLTAMLDQLMKEASKFQLISVISTHAGEVSLPRNFTSRCKNSDIIGFQFDEDSKSMIKLLIMEDQINLFAITGMGGIGKTTLAQKIYNDERIKAHFEVRIWVCVTQQFTDTNILKEIISGAGGSYAETQTREQLEAIMNTTLQHKKFFLVLDDVWSKQVCNNIIELSLQSKIAGSRILITTRNEALVRELSGAHLHRMKLLPIKDGWSMLSKKVFQDGDSQEMQDLTNIGVKIVRKCKGLPLAISIVSGVLRTKRRDIQEWEKIFLDPAWSSPDLPNDVMRALYLAYQDLPANLKQCFVYCSLFPEDHLFEKRSLIQYWIAEGLVEVKERSTREETAEGYYKELLWRDLLQWDANLHNGCKMHGLLRFLAHFVAGEENFFGNLVLLDAVSARPRRLSIAAKGLLAIPSVLKKQEWLRTLLLFKNPLAGNIPDDFLHKLKHLRVLDVHDTHIECLPSCIGDLIHLRYLNVSGTRLRELPDSVEMLTNLQFLLLRGCESMITLPKWLVKLQSLRSLDLVGTQINRIPAGVGKLENLNSLLGFVADYGNQGVFTSTLEDLGSLTVLKYVLLEKLEKIPNGAEAARARLRKRKCLKSLILNWSFNIIHDQSFQMDKFKEVLEELCPSSSVEELEIRGYPGLEFPGWISSVFSPLTKLTKLVLHQCSSIQQLPQLGHLPELSLLYISGATAVTTIGTEFFGLDTFPPFQKLDTLIIVDMANWEDWQWQLEDGKALPRLRELQLVDCPKLKSLPQGLQHATTLTVLLIHGAKELIKIESLSSVKKLSVNSSFNLIEVSNISSLESLKISNCPVLKKLEHLNHLQELHIIDEWINCLPDGLREDTMKELRWVEIECNQDMFKRCLDGGSEWHKLQHIPDVHIHTKDGYVYLSNGNFFQSYKDALQATEVESDMAIVPVVANIPSTVVTTIIIPDTIIGRNEENFNFSFCKLLLLFLLIILVSLIDYFFLSLTEYAFPGSSLISFVIDAIFIFVTIPLSIVRDIFGFLSYAITATYKLFDKLVLGANYMSVSISALVEFFLDFLFSSPSHSFIFILSFLVALYGGQFR